MSSLFPLLIFCAYQRVVEWEALKVTFALCTITYLNHLRNKKAFTQKKKVVNQKKSGYQRLYLGKALKAGSAWYRGSKLVGSDTF